MNPDLWVKVEKLYHSVLERKPSERMAFLSQTSDDELRREVQSLLDHDQDGDRLLSTPPWQSRPTLAVGTHLGPYEILASIGVGGMGEVFRAIDTRLHREVAIKISAEQFTERFEREARVIASLNHPNICTLHDVGPNYLVMELVEGPTLADRIKQGALPFEEALAIARQIASALEAAHEKGIIHRDLKPGNIKITAAGLVKVLDFGLAKAADQPYATGDPTNTPTLTTQAGMILGTAAYMSPEQAASKTVDKRADVWSFGVVLWELVTGRRLFDGETVSHTLADVLRAPIDFEKLPEETPPAIRAC